MGTGSSSQKLLEEKTLNFVCLIRKIINYLVEYDDVMKHGRGIRVNFQVILLGDVDDTIGNAIGSVLEVDEVGFMG